MQPLLKTRIRHCMLRKYVPKQYNVVPNPNWYLKIVSIPWEKLRIPIHATSFVWNT